MMQVTFRKKLINYTNNSAFFEQLGGWEPETFNVLDRFLKKDSIFIDLGAWNGILSIYAALLGARVFAVEPDNIAYEHLLENIIANNIGNRVQVLNIAISDENGMGELNSMGFFGDSESSLIKRKQIDDRQSVIKRKFSSFMLDLPLHFSNIFIKMDIEGSEIAVLKEALPYLEIWKLPMYISFHPAWMENWYDDVQYIVKNIFPLYYFVGSNESDFINRMLYDGAHHSFLLMPRT